MVHVFLGLGALWFVVAAVQVAESWGEPAGLKIALSQLLMALLNVSVAWYLHWRRERRSDRHR